MATLALTLPRGSEAGATIRKLAKRINECASALPDGNPTGVSTVLTIDSAPSGATVSVQITAGPITTPLYTV